MRTDIVLLFAPHSYIRNLSRIYVVHPTWWTKVSAWFVTTFMASDIKPKMQYIDSVSVHVDIGTEG